MNTLIKYTLLAVTAGILTLSAIAPVVEASPGGFGGRPANPSPDNPRSQDIFIYQLKGGDTKNDQVLVANNTGSAQTIEIYPTDVEITNTGAYSCKQRSEEAKDVGSWVRLEKSEVLLQPGESQKVDFDISVPQTADVGEHNGCLAFEAQGDEGEVDGNVRIRTRSAVRMSVVIPGDLKRDISITSFSARVNGDGSQNYMTSLRNEGNVSADTNTIIKVHSLFGNEVYQNQGTYPVIAGKSYEVQFTNSEQLFWGGWYRVSAEVEYGSKAGSFGIDGSDKVTKKAQDIYIFATPSTIALLVYFLVLAMIIGAAVYAWYKHHDKHEALRNWKTYHVKEGDTLQDIAEAHDVSWKKLARINGLHAPYTLKASSTLKVPHKQPKR